MTENQLLHCFSRLLLPLNNGYSIFPSDEEISTILSCLDETSIHLFHRRHQQCIEKLGAWLLDADGQGVFADLRTLCQKVNFDFNIIYAASCGVIYYETCLGVVELVSLRQNYEDTRDLAKLVKPSLNQETPEKLAEVLSRKSLAPATIPDFHFHRVIWDLKQSYSLIEADFFRGVWEVAQSNPGVEAVLAEYQEATYRGAGAIYNSNAKVAGLDEVSICPYCNKLFEWHRSRGVTQTPPHCNSKKCKAQHTYTKRKEFKRKTC